MGNRKGRVASWSFEESNAGSKLKEYHRTGKGDFARSEIDIDLR